jgi:MATE family multidrug resistance protein
LLPFLVFSSFRQYLQAMGVALPVVIIMAGANVVNILGNAAFVLGTWGAPRLGVKGSALSTCLARAFMMVSIIVYVFWRDQKKNLGLRMASRRLSQPHLRELVRLGTPASAQILLEAGVFSSASILAGWVGTVPLAAHQIVLQIASTLFMMPLGLGAATSVRVGQSLGAGDLQRAVRVGWTALGLVLTFMTGAGLLIFVLARPVVQVFTADERVVGLASGVLAIVALFQLSDGAQVVASGILRGTGNTRLSMYANLIGHWMIGLPIGYILCFSLKWGIQGLWVGLASGLTAVALTLMLIWRKKARKLIPQRV